MASDLDEILRSLASKHGVKQLCEIPMEELAGELPENIDSEEMVQLVERIFDIKDELDIIEAQENQVDYTNSLSRYVLQMRSIPRISDEEERELIERYNMGQTRALEELIEFYLPLVLNIAREKGNKREEILDFIQEGNIALVQAVQSYDPDGARSLRDYVRWKVRKGIVKYQRSNERTMHIPKKLAAFFEKFQETVSQMRSSTNRAPELEEIAAQMGEDVEAVRRKLLLGAPLFQDEEQIEDEDRRFLHYVKDAQSMEELGVDNHGAMRKLVEANLDILDPVEEEILRLHYGLGESDRELDLYEISDELGLKSNHVRDLKTAAMMKISRSLQNRSE